MALALALACAALAAVAQAQVPVAPGVPEPQPPSTPVPELPRTPTAPVDADDPCPELNEEANTDACDTEYTPVAKDATEVGFEVMAGAKFGEGGELHSTSTPFTVDFFTNAFAIPEHGFFAGAECRDPNTAFDAVDDCDRAPAIYEYTVPPGQPGRIEQVLGPGATGESERGYIAEIAWITPDKAIAVGGSGSYPRRELPRASASETDAEYAARDLAGEEPNAAGHARVWVYHDGEWDELEDLPKTDAGEPMAALTTVDCSTRVADGEFCIAGGMRQLWYWKSGAFTESITPTSKDANGNPSVTRGAGWRFRVRAVRFTLPNAGRTRAIAVTSGCCAEAEVRNTPRLLLLDIDGPWSAEPLKRGNALDAADVRQSLPDSYYALNQEANSLVATPGGPSGSAGGIPEHASRVIRIHIDDGNQWLGTAGCLLMDAGSNSPEVTGDTGHLCSEVVNPRLASVRLLSGDGDFASTPNLVGEFLGATGTPRGDGAIDWAAGVLRSSGQGIVYTTTKRGRVLVNPTDCAPVRDTVDCGPADQEQIERQTASSSLYGLDSYALNSLAFVPGGAVAWAAGDKGAIARLGGVGGIAAGSAEPDPPRLGAARPGGAPDSAAYDRFRSPESDAETGDVPALSARPEVELAEPRLVPAGSPAPLSSDDVRTMVMSRDGSEGWALGTAPFHYTGGRWELCDATRIPGQTEPDPACEDLPPSTGVIAAARVPLELDGDPTNDDEFEVLALTADSTSSTQRVLRFRQGRWELDDETTAALRTKLSAPGSQFTSLQFRSIVFTSPEDGWALAGNPGGSTFTALLRFDGERWINCGTDPAGCGGSGVLPVGPHPDVSYSLTTAGERVYLHGNRVQANTTFPFIFSLDTSDPEPSWDAEYDPGSVERPAPEDQGTLTALSIAEGADGKLFGWAAGRFGPDPLGDSESVSESATDELRGAAEVSGPAPLLRLDEGEGADAVWTPWRADDAARDHLLSNPKRPRLGEAPKVVALTGSDGEAFIASGAFGPVAAHPMLSFQPGDGERWRVLPTPFAQGRFRNDFPWLAIAASVRAVAPDGQGGFWLATRGTNITSGLPASFYHYTDRAPAEVFADAPHPIRERITDLAPGPDGQVWVTTQSSTVYRYDRILGWDRVAIPGWDPGRVITRASAANAVAIGPDGSGVVVGEDGRIANVDPSGVRLDRAAGAPAVCDLDPAATPCGTGRDLTSAAVAPDGSAMVGGVGRALLWRPAGGAFQSIAKPAAAISATFTDIAMPAPGRVWITTDTGQVFAGEGSGGSWSWTLENRNEKGQLVTLDANGQGTRLNAIAVDASGHGYAVGARGLVLERVPGGGPPWRRVRSGVGQDLHSVALPRNGSGPGALIGGGVGLILTVDDGRLAVARRGELTDPLVAARGGASTGRVVGLALQPGAGHGAVEAWAGTQVPGTGNGTRDPAPGAVLHYSSDPSDPLLAGPSDDPSTQSLPDAPAAGPGDLSMAAFGRSDCHFGRRCYAPHGTTFTNEEVTSRIVADLDALSDTGRVDLSLFTGDVDHAAGDDSGIDTPFAANVIHRRWIELVAEELDAAGVPLFGALGGQDLGQVQACFSEACVTSREAGAGTTEPWQDAFSDRPTPWGASEETAPANHGLTFEAVPGQGGVVEPGAATGDQAGARTHYALDIVRGGEPIARLIVLDNSMRSLSASDPQQNPTEAQADFLQRMLCRSGEGCTRGQGQEAIVAMNTPTYAYEASASGGGVETATDQATLETLLLQNDADLVISGRLGWNGLYYTLAPGLHCPSPGGAHPDPTQSPSENAQASGCDQGAQDLLASAQGTAAGADGLSGGTPTGELPTVVASGAGGTFGPVNEPVDGEASRGFWHGYSLVHLDTETGGVAVEQRPVFDWLSLHADRRTVAPRARLTLEGEGREVAGADTPLRYDSIDSAAITHRYDLLLADPDEPWLPCREGDAGCESLAANLAARAAAEGEPAETSEPNGCAPYLCLPDRVGTVDRTTGELRAGDGRYPQTFAVAMLSVADRSATYPLVFERSPSFVVKSALRTLGAPVPFEGAGATAPPPPPTPDVPKVPEIKVPAVPVPPAIPLLAAASPPEPQAPVPPAPPPPTQQPSPLDLSVAPTGLTVSTPAAVIQPPTPPVNPAPPSGARREARQRQAAAQKSGADAEEGAESGREAQSGGDPADGPASPGGLSMSRRDHGASRVERGRPQPSFTALARTGQPSAWPRGALYGGGIGLMAAVLALGFTTLRPGTRRREPELPAPAWSAPLLGARSRRR